MPQSSALASPPQQLKKGADRRARRKGRRDGKGGNFTSASIQVVTASQRVVIVTRAVEALRWAVSLTRNGGLREAVKSWRERNRNHKIARMTAELIHGYRREIQRLGQERGCNGCNGSTCRAPAESSGCVAEDGHSELAVGAECWLCGRVNCDCEASHPPQESSTTGPVTPKQRTIGIAQVTPDKADGCGRRKSLGSA